MCQFGEVLFRTCEIMKDETSSGFHGHIKQLLITPTWKYDDSRRGEFKTDRMIFAVEGVRGKFSIPGIFHTSII